MDDKIIEVTNTNKIVLISGININNIYNDKYYFKYTIDSKYINKLNTKMYLDNENDLDNIVDFFERGKNNIKTLKNIKYDGKIDCYFKTYNLENIGKKSAVLMFEYYNGSHPLFINLSISKNSFFSNNYLD